MPPSNEPERDCFFPSASSALVVSCLKSLWSNGFLTYGTSSLLCPPSVRLGCVLSAAPLFISSGGRKSSSADGWRTEVSSALSGLSAAVGSSQGVVGSPVGSSPGGPADGADG